MAKQIIEAIFAWLGRLANHSALMPPTPVNVPVEPILPQPEPVNPQRDILEEFCTAIRDYEGKPGDRNYKNNNPGNCRYFIGGYAPKYGHVTHDKDGFAIFQTYDLGWLYLKNMVRIKCEKNPNQTLLQFMSVYAPASENRPDLYANYIAKRLSVDKNIRMAELVV